MTELRLRRTARASVTLLAVLATMMVCSLVCRRLLYSIWYEISCGGFGLCGDVSLIEALGIECHGPRRGFTMEDLLLDESVFLEGWTAEDPHDPDCGVPAEQLALGFFIDGCPYSLRARHDAYRFYGGARCAEMGYRLKTPIWFARRDGWDPWSVPPELPYESPVADEFRFNCYVHRESGAQTCQSVGRYEEYVVRFLVHMDSEPEDPQCMSFTDLEQILIAIDQGMALYLGKATQ
ncbi:MAG TPA: hypothetical protein VMW58_02605 [Anaerolineae bacterium]|nr:hypothetical protein [Anaerolineae bacterium]